MAELLVPLIASIASNMGRTASILHELHLSDSERGQDCMNPVVEGDRDGKFEEGVILRDLERTIVLKI
jgi:hypothetical protein